MPNRYGHVPGHLGDALIDALEFPQNPPRVGGTVSPCLFYDDAQQARWDAMTAEDSVRCMTCPFNRDSSRVRGGPIPR